MGKRWNRNKAGGKRAYLKRFSSSMVNAGKVANKVVLGEHAARARSLATPPSKAVYDDNEAHYDQFRKLSIRTADDIIDSLNGVFRDSGMFWTDKSKANRVVLVNTEDRVLIMLMTGEIFQFIQQNWRSHNHAETGKWHVVYSIKYYGRENAMRKYRSAQICWDWSNAVETEESILLKPSGPKLDMQNFVR